MAAASVRQVRIEAGADGEEGAAEEGRGGSHDCVRSTVHGKKGSCGACRLKKGRYGRAAAAAAPAREGCG
jgi:hypothetical protein